MKLLAVVFLLSGALLGQPITGGLSSYTAGNASGSSPYPFNLSGVSAPTIYAAVGSLASGHNDLYTVPSAKVLFLGGCVTFQTVSGSITFYPELHVGSSYYRLASTGAGLSGANQNLSQTVGIVLIAGDKISMNVASGTAANITVSCQGILADSATAGLRSARLLGLSSSPATNTLLTVDAGHTVGFVGTAQVATPFVYSAGTISLVADAGGARTFAIYDVPNAGAIDPTNQLDLASGLTASTRIDTVLRSQLASQHSLVVTVDTGDATQIAWVNYFQP